MFKSQTTSNTLVTSSILEYKELILKDMNFSLRFTDENDVTYTTCVHKWTDDEVIFAAPIHQRDWVLFMLPTVVESCFITRKAIYMTTLTITERRIKDEVMYYKATITSPLVKKQQREHFRLETLTTLNYCPIPLTLSPDTDPDTLPHIPGTTLNISVGGMCMVSNAPLEDNQTVWIYLDFLGTNFMFKSKVLGRSSRNENGTYSHRIRFEDLDSKTENLLSRLIFEKQRQLMRGTTIPLYKSKA